MLRALPALRKEAAALSRKLGSPAVSVQQADAS
jgi:hypothetical protein